MQIIDVRGFIVPDEDAFIYRFFRYTVTCPKDVLIALQKAAGEPVTVRINSYGGDVWSGSQLRRRSQCRGYGTGCKRGKRNYDGRK